MTLFTTTEQVMAECEKREKALLYTRDKVLGRLEERLEAVRAKLQSTREEYEEELKKLKKLRDKMLAEVQEK